jgi:predicted dehydrogenase
MKKIRFGFLSTARIGCKNWNSIHASGNSIVTAVASRDAARSREFIRKMQAETPFETVPAALGSYEALIDSPNVDAIYVPLPTGLRKEWVLRAAAAGKHVVCEKPCGVNAAEVREMIAACKKNRVQFMDGVMFMHNPRMARLRKVLDDGKSIGLIKRITSSFSFLMDEKVYGKNIRINSQLEPAGCVGDLGWYNIRFSLWAMDWKMPREIRGRTLFELRAGHGLAPVPVDFSAELIFDEEATAGFYCSFRAGFQNWVHVSGVKGSLAVSGFVHGGDGHDETFELNQEEVHVKCCQCRGRHSQSREFSQPVNMMRNFARQIRSGKLNADWPIWALKTQEVVDACLDSAKKR